MARKAGITHERVLDAAAEVADREGLPAVSLASVAAAVGVRTPSLYTHVAGLDGLRSDLTRRGNLQLGQRLRSAAESQTDAIAALRAIAHAYRGFAREHPGLYASLLPVPRADADPDGAAAAAEPVGVVAEALAELGITPDRRVDLIRTLRATLHGFVDLENGDGFGLARPLDASFDAALDLVLGALVVYGTPRAT